MRFLTGEDQPWGHQGMLSVASADRLEWLIGDPSPCASATATTACAHSHLCLTRETGCAQPAGIFLP
jgi:hypothetical protein